ncbi:MAG: class I SAM-dependent methyltransferase, partial [Deltaproteobacteria bacterium]|nr:class I SAM-dependent methyltransferase [Deltaproteobacteria bacterium]
MEDEKTNKAGQRPDPKTYAQQLRLADFLREPVICSVIQALQLPWGSQGLDAGCGIGSHTLLLAEAVGPAGRVTGLDLCPEFLAQARKRAGRSDLSKRVSFQPGDLARLPFNDDAFD